MAVFEVHHGEVVFLLEPLAPFLLWPRVTRRWFALALIAMHFGLEILTKVGFWNYLMVGMLLSFLPAAWLARLLRVRDGPS